MGGGGGGEGGGEGYRDSRHSRLVDKITLKGKKRETDHHKNYSGHVATIRQTCKGRRESKHYFFKILTSKQTLF